MNFLLQVLYYNISPVCFIGLLAYITAQDSRTAPQTPVRWSIRQGAIGTTKRPKN